MYHICVLHMILVILLLYKDSIILYIYTESVKYSINEALYYWCMNYKVTTEREDLPSVFRCVFLLKQGSHKLHRHWCHLLHPHCGGCGIAQQWYMLGSAPAVDPHLQSILG